MAQVLLISTAREEIGNDYNRGALRKLEQSARSDVFGVHRVTDDPGEADVILFPELYGAGYYFEAVRKHPFVKMYREKCFLFCSNDLVIPFLPGVYASIEKRWSSERTRAGFFLGVSENPLLEFKPPDADLPYLFSFVGSLNTARVRRKLGTLHHPRSIICDTSSDYQRALYKRMNAEEEVIYWRRYAETNKASKFILCPRGLGVSSVRLFDTMQMGRVPVVLSDDWVEPVGPRWKEFVVRVRESDIARVPALLEERESEAISMGLFARSQWEEWFSESACFHRVVEWCLDIKDHRRLSEKWAHFLPYLQYLRPFHFRHRLRTKRPIPPRV